MRDMSRETCALFGFELARKPRAQDPLRLSRSILSCECSMNSFWNETHSGMKLILVSCELTDALSHACDMWNVIDLSYLMT